MRHMTNLESVLTYEGTEEIHTLVVGGALTGIRGCPGARVGPEGRPRPGGAVRVGAVTCGVPQKTRVVDAIPTA